MYIKVTLKNWTMKVYDDHHHKIQIKMNKLKFKVLGKKFSIWNKYEVQRIELNHILIK